MKIATFNINNISRRLSNLLAWLRVAKPDVVCLQELKTEQSAFPMRDLEKAGYGAVWKGQRSWNGVAILARDVEPILIRSELPGDSDDKQSRYIEAAIKGVLIGCLYAPNGNPQPGPKFEYKLAWLERLRQHAADVSHLQVPAALVGDYNIVPSDFDIYPNNSYSEDALLQPQCRALFRQLLGLGWTDAIRVLHPEEPMYTFWDYMRNRWPRNAGLRVDHLLLSDAVVGRLRQAGVDREVRGKEGASDHAPAWVILKDGAGARRNMRSSSASAKLGKPSRSFASERRPILVVDGDSFAHRSYHALPKTIRRRGNKPAGAILGFANVLLRLYCQERPRVVLVAWDTQNKPTYRHKKFPAYQSGRRFDDDLLEQLEVIPKFVEACGFANAKAAGYEADDFLAATVAAEERRGGTALVASGDRDSFQLASERTTILFPVRAGEMARIGPEQVRERYGVEPKQVPDFIALRGDPSDKVPGAPGVGANSAAALLRRHGSLENLLKAGRFPNEAAQLRLFRSIATMDRKAPLPRIGKQKPTFAKAAALAREWDLKHLAKRLDEVAQQTDTNRDGNPGSTKMTARPRAFRNRLGS
jgi:exodeoxyribonuclease III